MKKSLSILMIDLILFFIYSPKLDQRHVMSTSSQFQPRETPKSTIPMSHRFVFIETQHMNILNDLKSSDNFSI
jgi:hypothetical protein